MVTTKPKAQWTETRPKTHTETTMTTDTQTVSRVMVVRWPNPSHKITTISLIEAPVNPLLTTRLPIPTISLKNHPTIIMNSNPITIIIETNPRAQTMPSNKSKNTILPLLSCADKAVEESLTLTVSANTKKSAKKYSKTKDPNSTFNNKESSPSNKKNSWNKEKSSKKNLNKKRKSTRKNNKTSLSGKSNLSDSEPSSKPIVEGAKWPNKKKNLSAKPKIQAWSTVNFVGATLARKRQKDTFRFANSNKRKTH